MRARLLLPLVFRTRQHNPLRVMPRCRSCGGWSRRCRTPLRRLAETNGDDFGRREDSAARDKDERWQSGAQQAKPRWDAPIRLRTRPAISMQPYSAAPLPTSRGCGPPGNAGRGHNVWRRKYCAPEFETEGRSAAGCLLDDRSRRRRLRALELEHAALYRRELHQRVEIRFEQTTAAEPATPADGPPGAFLLLSASRHP